MNTKLFITAVSAIFAVACTKEQPTFENDSTNGIRITASVEQPCGETKTSLDGLNVKWTKGDQIFLTDGTNSAIYKADATAATTTFTKVSGDNITSGDVYAYYPAESVATFSAGSFTANIPAVQSYFATGFSDGVNPMAAKGTIAGGTVTLSFLNVMAFVKVQINDSTTGKILKSISLSSDDAYLSGTATVGFDSYNKPTISITTGSKSVEVCDCSAALSSTATPVYIAVPTGNLGKLTLSAKTEESDGVYCQSKTSANELSASRKTIHSYNVMGISTFNNHMFAPANCYMIDATAKSSIDIPLSQAIAGWDAIKAIETEDTFDKTKITTGEIGTVRKIDVRWLGGTGTIALTSIDATKMTLSLTCENGTNAVVDLMNGTEIVWSWHLWFTDYKPYVSAQKGQLHTYPGLAFKSGGLYCGKKVMDRNLGASATNVIGNITQPGTKDEALKFFGLYYQFGRKDPFAQTGASSKETISSKVTYAYAAQNPNKFFYYDSEQNNNKPWSYTDSLRTNKANMTDPWNSNTNEKSAFDPCPAGWKIPRNGSVKTENIFSHPSGGDAFFETSTDYKGGAVYNDGYSHDLEDGIKVWFPISGSLSFRNAQYSKSYLFIWGATPSGPKSAYYTLASSIYTRYYHDGMNSRAYGYNIRCVQE